jgi:TP901 family phage tail tape measure protein
VSVITNQYTIDAQQAVATLQSVQASFTGVNSGIGALASQIASFNRSGKGATATFVQIDQAGRKVTSTLQEQFDKTTKLSLGYQAVAVKIGVASNAQRRLAADMEKQRSLADSLAKSVGGGGQASRTPTTFPGAVNPALLGQSIQAYSRLTDEQIRAAAAANGLNAAQTTTLLNIVRNAGRATGAIDSIRAGANTLKKVFNDFGQIAFHTAIYRGLSLIQLGLTDGARSAAQYSRQIGLIQTLAVGTGDSYGTWDTAIRKVANDLALPAVDVATATYDALSNQVIKTTKDMDLLSVAGTLARNTNSNIGDSLNVLSSILNTYGSQAGTAQQISDELFRTVDLGRVRINELNGVIGRSAGIAKTAGVSLRELEAGLIVQTQAGLDSAESATLLNNVFSQLIKPNDALTAQFHKMGFEGGQAAVATLGFAGVMRQLAAAAKATDEGIATFFPEIRGLRGAATFAGEGIDKFEEALRALEKAQGANAKAAQTLKENLGQSLIDEGQRLKNFFTVDLGQKALQAISFLSVQIGGLDTVMKLLVPTVVTLGLVFGGVFAIAGITKFIALTLTLVQGVGSLLGVIKATDAAVLVLGASFSKAAVAFTIGFAIVAVAAAAVVAAITLIEGASENAAKKIKADAEFEAAALKKAAEEAATAQIAAFSKSADEINRKFGTVVAAAKRQSNDLQTSAKEAGTTIAETLKNNFGVMGNIAREGLNKLEEEQKKAAGNAKKIDHERFEFGNLLTKKSFDRQVKYYEDLKKTNDDAGLGRQSPKNDPIANLARITQQRNAVLRTQQAAAIGRGDLEQGHKIFNELLDNVAQLEQYKQNRRPQGENTVRGRTSGQQDIVNAQRAQAAEAANFNRLTDGLTAKDKARTVELAKQIEQEKQQVALLEDLLNNTAKFATKGVFDKEGNLLQKFIGKPEDAEKQLAAMQSKAIEAAKKLRGAISDPLTKVQYGAALGEIQKSFGDQRSNLQEQINLATRESNLTKFRQTFQETINVQKQGITEVTQQYRDESIAITDLTSKLRESARVIVAQSQTTLGTASVRNYLFSPDSVLSQKDTDAIKERMNEFFLFLRGKTQDLGKASIALSNVRRIVDKAAPDFVVNDPKTEGATISYLALLDRMQVSLGELQKQTNAQTGHETQLTKLKKDADAANAAVSTTLGQMAPGLQGLATAVNTFASTSTNVDKFTQSMERATKATSDLVEVSGKLRGLGIAIPAGTIGPDPEKHAGGGQVKGNWWSKFLTGGFASGTDTVPAMLSKREFVIRAPMADRYYSQLVAMNAGTAPVYRSQGGSVTTTVGDININISGGKGNSLQMSKDVANHIRRGIKQGTLKL